MSERRYRGKQSRPIPVWNGVLEHRSRIDAAIWVFLWLLDAITEEREGIGIVLGGAPVKTDRIAEELSFDEKTVRQHLKTLERGHYIKRRRTPYGFVFNVCKSRKFGVWSAHKRSGDLPAEIGRKHPDTSGENTRCKEDAAVTQQKDAAAAKPPRLAPNPEDSVWEFLKISPGGPIAFRTLLESRWTTRNGGPASVVIGETVDAWKAAEEENPRGCAPLFRALKELRQLEARARERSGSAERNGDDIVHLERWK